MAENEYEGKKAEAKAGAKPNEWEIPDECETGPLGTKREFIIFSAITLAIGVVLFLVLDNFKQAVAGTIFMGAVISTLMFWRFRVAIAFIGVVLLLLTQTIDLKHTIEYMSLDVILFLVGMMVIVGVLRQSGFFRWLLGKGLKLTRFQPTIFMATMLFLAALMAALVDEVTSILFVSALVLELCDYFEIKPVKYIISVVLATNIGSTWTVLGNPIGILIALKSGLSFESFLETAFPVGLVSLFALIIIVLIWQRRELRELKEKVALKSAEGGCIFLDECTKVKDPKLFKGSAAIFIGVIGLLAAHYRLEIALGLEHNTLLVATSIAGAGGVMLWRRNEAQDLIRKGVDWWTLLFFMFLFAKAGTLAYVGLTDVIAKWLTSATSGGGTPALIVLVLWLSGFASAAMDNVVVVASLAPVLQALTPQVGSPVLWWALLFGGAYGGNMTMVGSTANIVALGMLDQRGSQIKFTYWLKIGLLGSLVPMAIGTVMLLLFAR